MNPKNRWQYSESDLWGSDLDDILGDHVKNPLGDLGSVQKIWFERSFDGLLVNEGALIINERIILNFVRLIRDADGNLVPSPTTLLDLA